MLWTVLVASGGAGILALAGLASCAAGAAVLVGAGAFRSRVWRCCGAVLAEGVAVLAEGGHAGSGAFTGGGCVGGGPCGGKPRGGVGGGPGGGKPRGW